MKKTLGMCLALMVCFSLAVFAGGAGEKKGGESKDAASNGGKKIELKFSTSGLATETPIKGLQKMKVYIEETSKGQITLRLFLQSSLLTQEQEIPAIMKGNLEMCYSEAPWLVDYMPELAMYGSAYLFQSVDHWKKFYESDLSKEMFEKVVAKIGVRPLGAFYLGSRLINLKQDIKVLSRTDLKNIKLRMPSTDAWLFLGEALGGNPVPIPYADLYLALQTGTVDGQDNPLTALKNRSFFEVTKSATLTRHVFGTNWIMLGEKKWKTMTPEQQAIVKKGADIASSYTTETNLKDEEGLVLWLKEKGMKIHQPTTEELAGYRKEVLDYYFAHEKIVGSWDMKMHRRIQNLVK